jgi:hypothetical protein
MSNISYSFHFVPEEDRLALSFSKNESEVPDPVLLTRRLVRLLGSYLRHYIEKNTSLPETVSAENKDDIFQFMHLSELENNTPQWEGRKEKKEEKLDLQSAELVNKVDIKYTEEKIRLMFYQKNRHLVSLTLGWKQVHSFLYSLAEMSKKADWSLENVFEWSGQVKDLPEMVQRQ